MSAKRSQLALGTSRRILRIIFGPARTRTFAVRYWDGSEEGPAADCAVPFTLVLRHPGALRRMLLPPSELRTAEAYLRDDFDVEGNLEQVMGLVTRVMGTLSSPPKLARLAAMLALLPDGGKKPTVGPRRAADGEESYGELHSRERDARSVRAHYDVGNDFYRIWLGRRMVYSCAYFPTGAETIDQAQEAKLEHICRKLRLQPGESLLDIGCGWGSLVQYAAEHYQVRATGITLSEEQAGLARECIARAGLTERATIEVRDYRDLPAEARFDKVASIGMLEHVGRARMDSYFAEALRVTRPGGLFLAHGIIDQTPPATPGPLERAAQRIWGEGSFIDRYVFPDGELLKPWELARSAESAGWEIRDLENLREHYARTLRLWIGALEAGHEEAVKAVGETTYRVWRLYMSGSANGFATGSLGVMQYLLSRRHPDGTSCVPATRADLYSSS